MIDHPNSRGPFSEPGCLGYICMFSAPVLAFVVGLDGNQLLLALIAVFIGVVCIGAVFGKK